MARTKRAIAAAARRQIAHRYGCSPGKKITVRCAYCEAEGTIKWWPGRAWVSFQGLEIDHVVPESKGGGGDAGNLVLACRRCNRRKGAR